jgi:predicted alpha/beta-fold hydrolase
MPPNGRSKRGLNGSKSNGEANRSTSSKDDDTFHECQDVSSSKKSNGSTPSDLADDDCDQVAYRSRIYGTLNKHEKVPLLGNKSKKRLMKRLSQRFSKEVSRRRTSIVEALPETPTGWVVLVSALSSLCLGYEVNLQKTLTVPPTIYSQLAVDCRMKEIYNRLTATPESILRRTIQPSLFVGTRGVIASTAAYLHTGPSSKEGYQKFREVVTMSQDGAEIALDWELPPPVDSRTAEMDKQAALHGPNPKHVVLILHGINNDANFGYVKSLMRACTHRGWAAVGMNFRGCGGVALATPRGYNGAYTGDIRGVVRILTGRLAAADGYKLFIVGNSLGANLITKYLGEEGRSGTLPESVSGGISLGNPLHLHGQHIKFPWGHILSLGARKTTLEHLRTFRKFKSAFFQDRINKALMASTLGAFDEAMAPVFLANNSFAPFETKIGYDNGEDYWKDASSYHYVRYISVPLLQLTSDDDFLVAPSSGGKLNYSLSNPNVMVVNTRCGGHLGWRECPPDTGSIFGFGTSWADTATTDFIDAVLQGKSTVVSMGEVDKAKLQARQTAEKQATRLSSRL